MERLTHGQHAKESSLWRYYSYSHKIKHLSLYASTLTWGRILLWGDPTPFLLFLSTPPRQFLAQPAVEAVTFEYITYAAHLQQSITHTVTALLWVRCLKELAQPRVRSVGFQAHEGRRLCNNTGTTTRHLSGCGTSDLLQNNLITCRGRLAYTPALTSECMRPGPCWPSACPAFWVGMCLVMNMERITLIPTIMKYPMVNACKVSIFQF